MNQKSLKVVECSGTPHEMGRQYGEQAWEEIRHNVNLFAVKRPESILLEMKHVLDRWAPEILDELAGMAEGAQVDLYALLAMNCWELNGGDADRCTVVVVHSPREGILIAKNNDSPPTEDGRFLIRRGKADGGLPFFQVGYAGSLSGLDMMNAEGLCNTHGSVGSCFARTGMRLDIRLQLYRLMQRCRNTDELVAGLNEIPLTGKGFSIAVADKRGSSVILDAAVPFLAVRARDRAFAYSTNLYEYPGMENSDMRLPEKRTVCVCRQGYLRWREENLPPQTLDDLKQLLSSHDPWAPCRHGGLHKSITDWSMIGLPQTGKLLVAHGSPCNHRYHEYSLS